LPSDGEQILRILRGRDRTEPGDLLREFRTLSRVWRESGDWRALRAHTVVVAQCWAGLGDAGRAQELLEEARGVDAEPSRPHRAYETLVGGEVALARGDLAGAGSQFTEAEAEFRRLDHPAGLLLTALARGRLLLRLGDTAATLTYFEEVATSPLLRRLPALRPLVDRQIRYCRYERPGGGGVDASLADYESLPPHERSPLQDRQVYTEVAAARERAGRHEQAAEAYGRALEAVAALDQSFSDPDRERFRSTQSGLIRAAQKSLRATGREEEAAKVDSFFLPAAEIERQEKVPPRGDG
jgi:tetratricopeptide (TPR) repeat protein